MWEVPVCSGSESDSEVVVQVFFIQGMNQGLSLWIGDESPLFTDNIINNDKIGSKTKAIFAMQAFKHKSNLSSPTICGTGAVDEIHIGWIVLIVTSLCFYYLQNGM